MSEPAGKPVGKFKRALFVRWLALWPLTLGLVLYPISSKTLRVATVAMLAALWIGSLLVSWRRKWVRTSLLGLPALLAAFAVLPGHAVDRTALREEYVASLRGYEGCRYVWGGENRLGIDCSGLVRSALINASLRDSVRTLNPALLRFALDLWWHDSSAEALGQEHRQQTLRLFDAPSLNDLDTRRLQPGDLAVTRNGVHVLAYLGDNQWIEADPGATRVQCVTVSTNNGWFSTSMNLMRWRILESGASASPTSPL